jgi:hypothetical protein
MTSRILQELTPDKLCQQVALPVLEEISPREAGLPGPRRSASLLATRTQTQSCAHGLPAHRLDHLAPAGLEAGVGATEQCRALAEPRGSWAGLANCLGLVLSPPHCWRVEPLRLLMRLACQPLCQPSTPGAFCFGRRLIAIDSKLARCV